MGSHNEESVCFPGGLTRMKAKMKLSGSFVATVSGQ